MKRLLISALFALGLASPASAQLTVMPIPLAQWFDNVGAPLSDGGLCVFRAGTSTLATTYTTAAGSVVNSNPIEFDASGRPTSGGVFLTPGQSYKFLLKDFTGVVSPTCVPDTGVTLWSVDNVQAVPGAAGAVDITGTAGESIAAGSVVYMSDGSGSKTQGQWYLADADLDYASVTPTIGLAPLAVASGATGAFRISGFVDGLAGLSAGTKYYVSTTAGGLSSTLVANGRLVGQAQSATAIVIEANPALLPTIWPTVVTLTDGASVSLNAALGGVFSLTAAGNRTILAPTNPLAGQKIIIAITASGGARTITLTTGSSGAFRFGTDITGLSATSSGLTDYIGCVYNATAARWEVVAYSKGY